MFSVSSCQMERPSWGSSPSTALAVWVLRAMRRRAGVVLCSDAICFQQNMGFGSRFSPHDLWESMVQVGALSDDIQQVKG